MKGKKDRRSFFEGSFHRNLTSGRNVLAQVLQIVLGKEHLEKNG
jgi:hypothetical protein